MTTQQTAAGGAKPFVPIREAIVYCPNSAIWNALTPSLKQRHFMCYWPEERIHRHAAMLAAFGFNAMQVSVVGQMPRNAGQTMEEWVRRVNVQVDAAREHGMSVTQFVWGNAISSLAPDAPTPNSVLDWHQAKHREVLHREWERSAQAIGSRVDRVVTHWNDPGGATAGCPDCRIGTAIEMHTAIMDTFRGVNPGIEGYFSNWMLYTGNKSYGNGWPGYEGVSSILNDPAFDPASGVALGIMNCAADGAHLDPCGQLRADDLRRIRSAGRKAAVWAWYTTDMEIQPAIHVHTRLLQNYARSLPPETPDTLSWHTLDDCCSGLNMHNLFVAGRLMQDPGLDARALLGEYADGFVGAAAAPALVRALDAIEHARCRSMRYWLKVGDPHEGLHADELEKDATGEWTPAGWTESGSIGPALPPDWVAAGLRMVRSSRRELARLSLPAGHATAWPVTLEPAVFLDELAAHLRAIEEMLVFLDAAGSVRTLHAAGAEAGEIAAALASLPQVGYDPAHTAGLEQQAYRQHLERLKSDVQGHG